ncbi:hypothetical protein acsn021_07100 [Anaerocolumna cellulosilytica]|uniref:Uncharacterized protein n=1 Tax=Anaerocolumna cellulosilytica TaxID=433286 RepID=A0A6S6R1Q5_9FIRM|nr:zinc-ribbon domain-containing protein [Anaerocolumna cellulosilytica]MBB5198029.1 putative membrane protein YvbJ [Anaerocolumna cellulosilytica]BCJ93141.1 hypothetical protein acsn021_07100 [Anaerocolumna cellulosilytica]
MICKVCGRSIGNEEANYCEYCGTSLRNNTSVHVSDSIQEHNKKNPERNEVVSEENEKTISFGNWVATMLLPFIPFVGIFIYLIMMCIWSFGSDTPKSKRNWARASLVVGVIVFIIFMFMIATTLMDILNSGVDLESYLNNYMKQYY